MYLKLFVKDPDLPHDWGGITFRMIRLKVDDNATVGRIKQEILPKVTSAPSSIFKTASLTRRLSKEALYGRLLFYPEHRPQEIMRAILSLAREAKLHDNLSLLDQRVTKELGAVLSVDVDFATQCSRCQKPLEIEFVASGLVGYVFGGDCFQCGLKRTIFLNPYFIDELRDTMADPVSAQNPREIEVTFHVSDWARKESQRQEAARSTAEMRREERHRAFRRAKERCPIDGLRCPLGYYGTRSERKKCPLYKCPLAV